MATARIQHDFDCTEPTMWQVFFFDQEYNHRLYLERLKFPVWRVLDQKVTDDFLERKVEIHPLLENVPGPLQSMIGNSFHYIEEGKLDRKKNRYVFRAIPSTMADKTHISGEMYAERISDKRVRRIIDFRIDVKVMVIGKLIEQKSISDTKASYDAAAIFTEAYLKEKGLSTNP